MKASTPCAFATALVVCCGLGCGRPSAPPKPDPPRASVVAPALAAAPAKASVAATTPAAQELDALECRGDSDCVIVAACCGECPGVVARDKAEAERLKCTKLDCKKPKEGACADEVPRCLQGRCTSTPPSAVEVYAPAMCRADSDCVLVAQGCCGCANTAVSKARERSSAWQRHRARCAVMKCTIAGSFGQKCAQSAICTDGTCRAVGAEAGPEPGRKFPESE